MKVKEYLSQLFWIDKEIKSLSMEREELFASTFKHPVWSDMKVQSSPTEKLEDIYVELAEYANRIQVKSDELLRLKLQLSEQIEKVENHKSRQLLRYRYLIGMNWEEVAYHMGYEVRHITRLHGQALIDFEHVLECPEKSLI